MRAVGVGKKGSRQQDVKANAHWSVSDAEKNIMMLKIITIIKKWTKTAIGIMIISTTMITVMLFDHSLQHLFLRSPGCARLARQIAF